MRARIMVAVLLGAGVVATVVGPGAQAANLRHNVRLVHATTAPVVHNTMSSVPVPPVSKNWPLPKGCVSVPPAIAVGSFTESWGVVPATVVSSAGITCSAVSGYVVSVTAMAIDQWFNGVSWGEQDYMYVHPATGPATITLACSTLSHACRGTQFWRRGAIFYTLTKVSTGVTSKHALFSVNQPPLA